MGREDRPTAKAKAKAPATITFQGVTVTLPERPVVPGDEKEGPADDRKGERPKPRILVVHFVTRQHC